MTYSESLSPHLISAAAATRGMSDDQLANVLWDSFRGAGMVEGLGGGDKVARLRAWLSTTVERVLKQAGGAGREMAGLLENEATIEDVERIALLVAFFLVFIPELRPLPINQILAFVLFEIRRRIRDNKKA